MCLMIDVWNRDKFGIFFKNTLHGIVKRSFLQCIKSHWLKTTPTVHMHLLPLTSLPFPLDSLFLTFRRKPEEEESFVGETQGLSVPVPEGDCGLESSVVLLEVLTGRAVSGSCFWPLAVWEMTGKDRLSCSDLLRCGGPGNSSSSA